MGLVKKISLKQALFEGACLDLFLFLGSSTIMDSGFLASITFFIVIAHQFINIYLACRFKGGASTLGMYFIRFGAFYLILIAVMGRVLMSVVFHLMSIDWY